MDGSETGKEVTFHGHGTTDLDSVHENSSEDLTVKIPMPAGDDGRAPTVLTREQVKSEENINSILAYLVDEIKSLKVQIEHQSKSGNPSEISTDEDLEEDNVSVTSKLGDFIPVL